MPETFESVPEVRNQGPLALEDHTHTNITPLDADSRLYAAPPTDYPTGLSMMPCDDDGDIVGSFGYEYDTGALVTHRWLDATTTPDEVRCVQVLYTSATGYPNIRAWDAGDSAWTPFTVMATTDYLDGAIASHVHANIVPLAEDTHAESAAITAYPNGISIMEVSATAGGDGWDGNGLVAQVRTYRTPGIGYQVIQFDGFRAERHWDFAGSAWHPYGYEEPGVPDIYKLNFLAQDVLPPEASGIAFFDEGLTGYVVNTAANYGPNTGEAGHLLTERNGTSGTQVFQQYSDGKRYTRTYTGGAWGAWTAYSMEGHAHGWAEITGKPSTFTPSSHGASHAGGGSDAIANAVASGAAGLQSGADKAKLDGIEASATADQTAAEILAALITVDGPGTTLNADLLDGMEASAFATPASVTAAVDAAIDALVDDAPTALNTLKEIADALADDDTAIGALTTAVNNRLTQAQADLLYRAIGWVPAWTDVTGKPSTFPPSAHDADHNTHNDARYRPIGYVPAWTEITSKPSTFPHAAHDAEHNTHNDARYRPIGYVPAWTEVTGKPSTFPPEAHSHTTMSQLGSGTPAAGKYLDGGGAWTTLPSSTGGANVKQTEIDFGATPREEQVFTVTDADVSGTSQITGSVAFEAPTGKDRDEVEMDPLNVSFGAGAGELSIFARALEGRVYGAYKINYLVG